MVLIGERKKFGVDHLLRLQLLLSSGFTFLIE